MAQRVLAWHIKFRQKITILCTSVHSSPFLWNHFNWNVCLFGLLVLLHPLLHPQYMDTNDKYNTWFVWNKELRLLRIYGLWISWDFSTAFADIWDRENEMNDFDTTLPTILWHRFHLIPWHSAYTAHRALHAPATKRKLQLYNFMML